MKINVYNPDGSLDQKKEGCDTGGANCDLTTDYSYDEIGRLTNTAYNQTHDLYDEWYFYDGDDGFTVDGAYGALAGGSNAGGRLSATLIKQVHNENGYSFYLATVTGSGVHNCGRASLNTA